MEAKKISKRKVRRTRLNKKPVTVLPPATPSQMKLAYVALVLKKIPTEKLTLDKISEVIHASMGYNVSTTDPRPWLKREFQPAIKRLLRKSGFALPE